MLEIIILFNLGRSLRAKATARGASEWWAALGPLMWIGGEFSAFFAAGALGFEGLAVYPFGLAYAALGAWLAFFIVGQVPARPVTND